MLKRIDFYIIKKVLGTYFLSILMIISIAIIIDITEKMDNFYNENLSLNTIIMDYYIHFIPFYINLFSSLFAFIAVLFVTSKLAFNSEIIAMLAGGISFKRILVPYFISAAIIALFTFYIGSYIIPRGNDVRLDFESRYVDHIAVESTLRNVQFKVNANEIAYMERFDLKGEKGYRFSLDKFEGKKLVSRITATTIKHDSLHTWTMYDFMKRDFVGMREILTTGDTLKREIEMTPKEFVVVKNHHERMTNPELREYINSQSQRGRAGLNAYKLEYQKRFAMPFGAIILTLIGVSVASRKTRGGAGFHVLIGFALSVTYILCALVSSSFTVKGGWNPIFAIWLPNIVYSGIGIWLYRIAPK